MSRGRPFIAVVGAGRMGRGIAQVFAHAGHPVTLIDLKQRQSGEDHERVLAAARAEIEETLDFLRSVEVLDSSQMKLAASRIEYVSRAGAEAPLAEADIIFEGVPEVLEAKKQAFGEIGGMAQPQAIISSTTSTMLVDTLAEMVPHPERFLNAHWLNPAFLIPLVEVSPGTGTSEEATDTLIALLSGIGKVPVRCAASPGYIVPRLQAVACNEAARMVEEGVASAEDIDKAVRAGFGIRYAAMGLVEFIDWGGVDTLYYASNYLKNALGNDRYAAPPIVEGLIAEGKLGMGAGQGFRDFSGTDVDAYRREKLAKYVALLRHLDLLPTPAPED